MGLLVVGIGDCRLSGDAADTLVTHALGSCIGIVIYDPIVKVAGLLHYMLPESHLDLNKAEQRPFMFADTGIPLLFAKARELGAVSSRMVVMAVGGAQMLERNRTFNIGQRNHQAMRKIFWKSGVIVQREEIGGTTSRTVRISVATGRVRLSLAGEPEQEMTILPKRNGASNVFQHTHRR